MSRSGSRRGRSRSITSTKVNWKKVTRSGLIGFGMFVLGFFITAGLKSDAISSQAPQVGSGPDTGHYLFWIFYKMHNVGHVATRSSGGTSQTQSFDPSTWTMWEDWLFTLPPLLLILGGFMTSSFYSNGDTKAGLVYGGSLVFGYFPFAVGGAYLSQYTQGGSASVTVGPKLVEAAVIAGIVYPVVFGIIGALVTATLSRSSATGPKNSSSGRDYPHQQQQHPRGTQRQRQRQPQGQSREGNQPHQQGQQQQGRHSNSQRSHPDQNRREVSNRGDERQ